jgi:hypothetical protein
LLESSFHVQRKNQIFLQNCIILSQTKLTWLHDYIIYSQANIISVTNLFPWHCNGGNTYSCIAKITAIVPFIRWYYKACKSCKVGYNNLTDAPKCSCQASQPMSM